MAGAIVGSQFGDKANGNQQNDLAPITTFYHYDGVQYGSFMREHSIDSDTYIKIGIKLDSGWFAIDNSEFVGVVITFHYSDGVSVEYNAGPQNWEFKTEGNCSTMKGELSPKANAVQKDDLYEFTFCVSATTEADVKITVEYDQKVSSEYDAFETVKFR